MKGQQQPTYGSVFTHYINEPFSGTFSIYFSCEHAGLFRTILAVATPLLLAQLVLLGVLSSLGLKAWDLGSKFDEDASAPKPNLSPASISLAVLCLITWFTGTCLAQGATTKAAAEVCAGNDPSWKQSVLFTGRKLAQLLGCSLLSGLIIIFAVFVAVLSTSIVVIGLGFLFDEKITLLALPLVVPLVEIGTLVFAQTRLAVFIPAIMLEERAGIGGLVRSWKLTSDRFWHTLCLFFPIAVANFAIQLGPLLLYLFLPGLLTMAILAAAGMLLIMPLWNICSLLIYLHLRMQEEDFSFDQFANEMYSLEYRPVESEMPGVSQDVESPLSANDMENGQMSKDIFRLESGEDII